MGCLVAILLFCIPILEIYVFISVSEYIGYLVSLSSIFFSGLLGFLVLRSVFNTLVSYKIQDFGALQLRTRNGILIVLGLGLLDCMFAPKPRLGVLPDQLDRQLAQLIVRYVLQLESRWIGNRCQHLRSLPM